MGVTAPVIRAGLGVESDCCHFSFVLSLYNATRELVNVSGGFRVSEVTAFRLGLAICMCSGERGLQDKIRNSVARYRYGCTAGDSLLFL